MTEAMKGGACSSGRSSLLKFNNVQVGILQLRHNLTTYACSCTFRMRHKMSQLSNAFPAFRKTKPILVSNTLPFTHGFDRPGRWQFSFTPGITMSI